MRLQGGEFPVAVPEVTMADLVERWSAIEGVSEPLARMAGLAGRWGDGSEHGHLQDALRVLTTSRANSGSSALIGVSTYPAYLIFLTYALGLTKAERWDELFRWLTTPIDWPHREPSAPTGTLFMSFWHGVEPDWWKAWPGMKNRRTPWADHLADVIAPWSRDYGLIGDVAVENYQILELLAGFAFLSSHDEEYLSNLQDFTWMPYGQTMWMTDIRSRILSRLSAPGMHARLLAAGFCQGSPKRWEGVVRNIGHLSRKIGW